MPQSAGGVYDTYRLILIDPAKNQRKFWQAHVELRESPSIGSRFRLVIGWGRIGSRGSDTWIDHLSIDKAVEDRDERIKKKLKEGYSWEDVGLSSAKNSGRPPVPGVWRLFGSERAESALPGDQRISWEWFIRRYADIASPVAATMASPGWGLGASPETQGFADDPRNAWVSAGEGREATVDRVTAFALDERGKTTKIQVIVPEDSPLVKKGLVRPAQVFSDPRAWEVSLAFQTNESNPFVVDDQGNRVALVPSLGGTTTIRPAGPLQASGPSARITTQGLESIARDRGFQRAPGESDQELAKRIMIDGLTGTAGNDLTGNRTAARGDRQAARGPLQESPLFAQMGVAQTMRFLRRAGVMISVVDGETVLFPGEKVPREARDVMDNAGIAEVDAELLAWRLEREERDLI